MSFTMFHFKRHNKRTEVVVFINIFAARRNLHIIFDSRVTHTHNFLEERALTTSHR